MTGGFWLAVAGAIVLVGAIVEMVRRRYIRGKFALTWLLVASLTSVLAVAPGLLDLLAAATGVAIPLNLLFFVGFLGLALIVIQLTAEHSRLERRLSVLAEQLALLTAQEEARRVQPSSEPYA
ncbi:DUF2304 domain-containing protein [Terrabacter sp. MAHUQ-38]|uniref:DUF2304 domain-containing protein n=1 Tax=unclassified Terrabacter TaxID=2630222 RepID=UPI00165E7A1B|nr:DUF2304 domain-containing protein [Terrabacter sp. MAHUQ-38]MBC9822506.1 DUF2304 domain-containing protein [Terrabacter sp. MAHUQ-38]